MDWTVWDQIPTEPDLLFLVVPTNKMLAKL